MRAAATRASWKTQPMPTRRATLTIQRRFSPAEIRRMRQGFIPREMEDKWFLFMEEHTLYVHRSWTGFCIYEVHFSTDGAVQTAWVNRDPAQYTETDNAQDERLLLALVDQFLLSDSRG